LEGLPLAVQEAFEMKFLQKKLEGFGRGFLLFYRCFLKGAAQKPSANDGNLMAKSW
jgi:hypothetical protein